MKPGTLEHMEAVNEALSGDGSDDIDNVELISQAMLFVSTERARTRRRMLLNQDLNMVALLALRLERALKSET